MKNDFNRFIHLVLQNNPYAISQKLVTMGMMSTEVNEPELVRQALSDQVAVQNDGGEQLLLEALDVPLNVEGEYAFELQQLFNDIGNRSVLNYFFEEDKTKNQNPKLIKNGFSFSYENVPFFVSWMEVLWGVFLLLLTIKLFQSIFLTKRT